MFRVILVHALMAALIVLLWPRLAALGFGHLPGDLVLDREHLHFQLPFATAMIISTAFTAVAWLLDRRAQRSRED
jgi:hypothetical protein